MTRRRFDALPQSAPVAAVRVDREAGIIYGISAMQVGPALGHGCACDAITIGMVVALGQAAPAGIKARFTHPGMCADGLGTYLGRMRDFRIEGDKAVADLHLDDSSAKTPNGDLREYVLTLAETDPTACGMSVVVECDTAWVLPDGTEIPSDQPLPDTVAPADVGEPMLRPSKLCAVDLVDEPAANAGGLFAARSTSLDAAEAFTLLDQARAHYRLSTADLSAFFARYLAARPDPSPAGLPPAAPETAMAITPARLLELSQAHPAHHDLILTSFAAGKDEADIMGQIRDAQAVALGQKADQLATELATTREALSASEANRLAEVAKLTSKLTALSAHLPPQDVGPGEAGVDTILAAKAGTMTTEQLAKYRAGMLRVVG